VRKFSDIVVEERSRMLDWFVDGTRNDEWKRGVLGYGVLTESG
jgi:hypothetical protein